jgi:sialidase-1
LEGKPWIWRASFPDWHTDMDSILLAKGFHVVFVDVDDEYGSLYSIQNPQSKKNACRIVHFLVNK